MASHGEGDEESLSVLDPGTLERLLRHLESTDVDELEVTQGDARIYLRREPGHRTAHVRDQSSDDPGVEPALAIMAPLTGVFFGRPSPEQASFVSEGDTVAPGQVVALIETMKLFNEVISDVHGEVTGIAAEDGDLVESGQPLVYLKLSAENEVA